MRLKSKDFGQDLRPVDDRCSCSTCRNYSRAFLHTAFKDNNALASQLLTIHNIAYLMRLMRTMRQVMRPIISGCQIYPLRYCFFQAILDGGQHGFEQFVKQFIIGHFPAGTAPVWVHEALAHADIDISSYMLIDTSPHLPTTNESIESAAALEL